MVPTRAHATTAACPDEHEVQAFVEHALTPADAARLEAHIDRCAACRHLIAELGRLAGGSRTRAVTEPLGDPARLPPGAKVDRYRVAAPLGQGGMGVVYAAHDEELDRDIALKLVRTGDASTGARTRVLREAKAIAKLKHPNVIAVYDVGTYEGGVFLAMELAEGGSVRAALAEREHGWQDVLAIYLGAGRGLAAAHAVGLVHRDFKPDNVLLGKDGRAQVADFGLARAREEGDPNEASGGDAGAFDAALAATVTKTGAILGTPAYMPPEQMRGERADARGDVFAFCVALYEGLYGERPFAGSSFAELRANVEAERVRPAPSGTRVPAWLRAAVLRGLRAKPEERYATMEALLAALEPPRRRTRPAIVATAAASVVAFVALGAIGLARFAPKPLALAGAPLPASSAAPPSAFAIDTRPERLTSLGQCAGAPAFADDGSLVFDVHDGTSYSIFRIPEGSRTAAPLVVADGENVTPTPGGPGRVLYVHAPAGSDVSQVWSAPLDGGPPRQELARADFPVQAGGFVFYVRDDSTAIKRRSLDGAVDEVLFEAPSSMTFLSLAVSPDASRVAAVLTGIEWRPRMRVCVGEATPGTKPDCDAAGMTTAMRVAFGPDGRALYFADGASLVRFDVAAGTSERLPFDRAAEGDPLLPSTLAIAPDQHRLIASSCQRRYEVARLADDGTLTPLPAASDAVGTTAIGPRGAATFPVAAGDHTALGVTDDDVGRVHVLASGDHLVSEAAFSPDGAYVVFHDATPETGGLFFTDAAGERAPRRITDDPQDSAPVWLDHDHVAYLHPEKGYAYGRAYVVQATGGEPRGLPTLPGILFGSIPSRGSLLLIDSRPSGDRFLEWTRDGKTKRLRTDGAPAKTTIDRYIASSPSGAYVTWFGDGGVWRLDVEKGQATRVPLPRLPGYAQTVQADDSGRLTISYRYSEGQLYEVRGTFR